MTELVTDAPLSVVQLPTDNLENTPILENSEWTYPDGGARAWVVVFGCFLYSATYMSWNWTWGIVQDHYHTVMFPDTSLGILSLVGCTSNFLQHATSYATGGLGDRVGYMPVIATSSVLSFVAYLVSAFSTKLWHIVLTQGVFLGLAQGLAMPLFMSLPSQWFLRHRGAATGLSLGGSGIGAGIFSLIMRELFVRIGYKRTMLIYSGIVGGLLLIGYMCIKERRPPGYRTEKKKWLPDRINGAFYSIALSVFFGIFGFLSPYHFMDTYVKQYAPAIDPNSLSIALPLVVMCFCGMYGILMLSGKAADAFGPINAFFLSFFFGGILQTLFWTFARSYSSIMVFCVLNGLTASWFMSLLPVVCAKLFGLKGLSTITGFMILANSPGQLAGAPLGGAIYESTERNWVAVSCYSGGMMLLGSMCALHARFSHDKRILARV
ncbi:MFS general substrate transporter [Cylindrobasidium torrendii FP15055 ss-10]|uniref:MFS general substrate transporter n=1 Tax=Cylindrobasidium torrendii FP15055 ss-10 TaxID=1314674 RepID=A0A0D7BD65_9AGAR|nr:MFS general substrate transporter [Cylindrobasidium torrendii FP15055 ss-10]